MRTRLVLPLHPTPGVTRCSVTDTLLRSIYPALLFCYRKRLDPEQLARSLARILDDFPTFAGKIVAKPERLEIDHCARGVRFEVAELDVPAAELEAQCRARHVRELQPSLSVARILLGREVLMAVRVTLTRDGTAICLSPNHVLGDQVGVMELMRAWTRAYEDRPYEPPLPDEDRDAYLSAIMPDPPEALPSVRLASWIDIARAAYTMLRPSRMVNIELSWDDIHAIHARYSGAEPVTRNDTLCARVFWTLRSLAGLKAPANLCLTVNYRKRVGIPARMPGNLVSVVGQAVNEHDTPAEIAAGLRSRLEQFATKHVDYHATKRVYDAHPSPRERARIAPSLFVPGRGDVLVYNWNNSGAYDLAFAGAKTSLYWTLSRVMTWSMGISELPDQAGYAIRISLPTRLARRLEASDARALFVPDAIEAGARHTRVQTAHPRAEPPRVSS